MRKKNILTKALLVFIIINYKIQERLITNIFKPVNFFIYLPKLSYKSFIHVFKLMKIFFDYLLLNHPLCSFTLHTYVGLHLRLCKKGLGLWCFTPL